MIDLRYAHVLVVEDSDDAFYIVRDLLLDDVGVRSCSRCLSSQALVECLDTPAIGLIDLLLFNIKRPLRYDFALVPTLRLHPKMITCRIVALTANIMPEDVERTQRANFDGFIGIPIDQARFPDQIRRILDDELVWEPR